MTEKRKILVVDDDVLIAKVTGRQLLSAGFEVVSTTDAGDALNYLKENHESLKLVLSDLSMPGLSGEELIGHSKELAPHLPIIVLSGDVDPATKQRLAELGVHEFIAKPVLLEELLEAINRAMKA